MENLKGETRWMKSLQSMSAKVRELAMMGVPKTRRSTWHCEVADPVGPCRARHRTPQKPLNSGRFRVCNVPAEEVGNSFLTFD